MGGGGGIQKGVMGVGENSWGGGGGNSEMNLLWTVCSVLQFVFYA